MKNRYNILLLTLAFLVVPLLGASAQTNGTQEATGVPDTVEQSFEDSALHFFYSPTCPHCHEEEQFLKKMESKYPSLTVMRYSVMNAETIPIMREYAQLHGVEYALGGVPLTFIGQYHFIGYNNDETTGKDIEEAILATLGITEGYEMRLSFDVPLLGRVYAEDFSLPMLAIVLGFLDGFNVCSLGALVLIIGLTLKLQRRKAIVLLGGTFIVTTALVYGGLIVAWFQIFDLFATRVDTIKIFVSLLALGGGIYFIKEYLRMRREGAVCQLQESKLINRLMERTGKAFEDNTKLVGLLGMVFLFAAVIAIVEFPCSAATPLVFAGMLSAAGVSHVGTLSYIALFVLFYMLDEIVIFAIAAYRLKLWMANGTFTKYAVLAEAIILIIIGAIYIIPAVGSFLTG